MAATTQSPEGEAFLKRREALRLKAYPDPESMLGLACSLRKIPLSEYRQIRNWETMHGGPWTIAWGHTRGVREGMEVDLAGAERLYQLDRSWVEHAITLYVHVPLEQCHFDGLASLIFNIGALEFETSHLLKKLNAGDFAGASEEFPRWCHSGQRVVPDLVARRKLEQDLFNNVLGAVTC